MNESLRAAQNVIDYEDLVEAARTLHKYRQGSRECVAFARGAEWATMTNGVVEGGEMCLNCGTVRASAAASPSTVAFVRKGEIPSPIEELFSRQVRGVHPYHFRSGKWANLIGISKMFADRWVYHVRFPEDGFEDRWVVDDPNNPLEFR